MTNATQGRRPTGPGAYRYIIDGHDVCDCLVTMHHDQRRLVCMWVGAWNGGKRFDRWEFVDEMPGDFIALSPPAAAPEPDWSQAPEWAMWTAINPSGRRIWCENKPRFFAFVDGMAYWRTEDGRERGEQIGLPYGVDTRTTLRRRPEVSGE